MLYLFFILIIFLVILPAYFLKKRKNVEVKGAVLCLFRTKRGLRLLDSLAKTRFWDYFSDMAIIFSFGLIAALYLSLEKKEKAINYVVLYVLSILSNFFILTLLMAPNVLGLEILTPNVLRSFGKTVMMPFINLVFTVSIFGGLGFTTLLLLLIASANILVSYLMGIKPAPSITPVIPGVEIPGSPIYIPLHAVFALVILVVVHEIAHGIIARREKIKVKSLGILTVGIFPMGAFTEPDEDELKRSPVRKRMRVFAAGSMANIITAFVFFCFFMLFYLTAANNFVYDPMSISPSFIPWGHDYVEGLKVVHVINKSNAFNASLRPGEIIKNIDVVFEKRIPGSIAQIVTENRTLWVKRGANGLMGFDYYVIKKGSYDISIWVKKIIMEILYWTFTLNFTIAIINYLPFAIFDGAHILEDLAYFFMKKGKVKKAKKKAKIVVWIFSIITGAALLLGALPYFT
ncbi:hypothetical protein DRN74_02970 [Candidatus Micrarchaeota archaeon]|nr:MAG: hypothetical protein DRN74_02970 [Candidatus Micrarchaeota archaeon]